MPDAVEELRTVARILGVGMLYLHLLSLFPRRPVYTVTSLSLLAVLKLSTMTFNDANTLLLYPLALITASSMDTDIRISLRVMLACLLVTIVTGPLTLALGWTEPVFTHMGALRGSSFGISNPNILSILAVFAVFLGLYISKERREIRILAVSWAAAAIVFCSTLSLTQAFLLLFMPLVYSFAKRERIAPWLLALIPSACLLLSVVLAAHYGPGYGSNSFESRFSIPAMVFGKYGLSPFGQHLGLSTWFRGDTPHGLVIDNVYLNVFLCSGVVVAVIALALLSWLFYMIGKRGDPLLLAISICVAVGGMMEHSPFDVFNFTALFFVQFLDDSAPAPKKAFGILLPVVAFWALCYMFRPWPEKASRPAPFGRISDIEAPEGFRIVEESGSGFGSFIGDLPLARPDSVLTRFNGDAAEDMLDNCFRVVDYPMIGIDEQCADVCMRLRAEYLFSEGRFREIRFADTSGKTLRYRYGACRPLLDNYLRKVFKYANTGSLRNSLPVRNPSEVAPGDLIVYAAEDRPGEKYGHAVMVASVAVDTVSSRTAVLLLQGSTPACDIHIVANKADGNLSPWHVISPVSDSLPVLSVGKSVYYESDFRYYE